jgi:hypothetical protein
MQFWKDFKREQGIVEELNQIDSGGGWFRKRKAIKVDFSFFRKPQDANIKVAVSGFASASGFGRKQPQDLPQPQALPQDFSQSASASGFGRKQGQAIKLKDAAA